MSKLTPELKEKLEKMHYEVIGNHTALEICSWCKKALRDEGECYKQKFYGIRSHMCAQMSPAAGFCDQKCIFCWRPQECNIGTSMDKKVDNPKEIIAGCVKAQKRKLSGFGGNEKTNEDKYKQAQEPMHFAISLTGEPTLYPKLSELIAELHMQGKTSFLVTNGQHPEVLEKLSKDGNLPTQLYISLDATTPEEFKRINIPLNKDGWQRLNKTLKLLPKLKCRKVIRITVINGHNENSISGFAKLLKIAQGTDNLMVEIKSYMHVGYSRKRLPKEAMPRHKEIRRFTEALTKELGWVVLDEQCKSRVVLIAPKEFKERIMKF
jgi:tRNA wybutosine-synthesizing protein 1